MIEEGVVSVQDKTDLELKIKYSYPVSDEYDYFASIERINLDEERKKDIGEGTGFIISSPKANIKKDIKDPDGIFSTRFGPKLGDLNPYMDRYSCQCGKLKHRVNHGVECDVCHTKCKYVGDNFKLFGWIVLNEHYVIHPDLYKSIETLCGPSKINIETRKKAKATKLQNMLFFASETSQDGHLIGVANKPADEPWYGVGMIEFYNHFDEIMEFYLKKDKKKKPIYDDIMADRDKVFTHSIPVYTTHLRPADDQDGKLFYEKTNADYNMINILSHRVNRNKTRMDRDVKQKNQYLYKLQMKLMNLYINITDICRGKKGQFRSLVGGRYNFSSRAVIAQDPSLRIDQLKLPYSELVITLQQQIINILQRLYNMSAHEAYNIVYIAQTQFDKRVGEIIMSIIKNTTPEGLPVILNRNPTIAYGSILQMFCVGYTDDLTIRVPLQVLQPLAADFDGDSLNIFHIINKIFFKRAYEVFNPRNAMYISRNDGKLNNAVMPQRDTIINANTLLYLGRHLYDDRRMKMIISIKEKQKLALEGKLNV